MLDELALGVGLEEAHLEREVVRGRGKLICGTGTYSTAETLELTQAAETMDPASLEAAIGARTRAIMPVSLYGQCADLGPLGTWAVAGVAALLAFAAGFLWFFAWLKE